MGTSTSQRSPRTPEWNQVRESYDRGGVTPREVIRRILHACGDEARALQDDPALLACLDHLPGTVAADAPPEACAHSVRDTAREALAAAGHGSHVGELALDALTQTALRAPRDHGEAVVEFSRQFLARAIEHLAARDLPAHVGAAGTPSLAAAAELLHELRREASQAPSAGAASVQACLDDALVLLAGGG